MELKLQIAYQYVIIINRISIFIKNCFKSWMFNWGISFNFSFFFFIRNSVSLKLCKRFVITIESTLISAQLSTLISSYDYNYNSIAHIHYIDVEVIFLFSFFSIKHYLSVDMWFLLRSPILNFPFFFASFRFEEFYSHQHKNTFAFDVILLANQFEFE